MNIKILIIENLRQLQINMVRMSYQENKVHSSYRGQGKILNLLAENPKISRTELGEKMKMSRAAIAELLNKMESKGLVKRTKDPDDHRRYTISLTSKGKNVVEKTDPDKSALPEMFDTLNGKELSDFNNYLERILDHTGKLAEKNKSNFKSDLSSSELIPEFCHECPGPEHCRRDYEKYGHDRPSPEYCSWADQFPFDNDSQ